MNFGFGQETEGPFESLWQQKCAGHNRRTGEADGEFSRSSDEFFVSLRLIHHEKEIDEVDSRFADILAEQQHPDTGDDPIYNRPNER